MNDHATLINAIADAYEASGRDVMQLNDLLIDVEKTGLVEVWELSREAIENGLSLRGLDCEKGVVTRAGHNELGKINISFEEFAIAAKRALKNGTGPMQMNELISATGIHVDAIPYANMAHVLSEYGIHFIPGLGYWTHWQYTDPATGKIMTRSHRLKEHKELKKVFEQHGWPLTPGDVERLSKGKVSSHFATSQAQRTCRPTAVRIAHGLYVPSDQLKTSKIPMSPNMAETLMKIAPDQMILDRENLRVFRTLQLMGKLGFAQITLSRTRRDGLRYQTIKARYTVEGIKFLVKQAQINVELF